MTDLMSVSEVNLEVNSKVNSEVNSKVNSEVNSKVNSEVNSKVNSEVNMEHRTPDKSSEPTSDIPNATEVKVISWNPIGIWTYNLPLNTCHICQKFITLNCSECSNPSLPVNSQSSLPVNSQSNLQPIHVSSQNSHQQPSSPTQYRAMPSFSRGRPSRLSDESMSRLSQRGPGRRSDESPSRLSNEGPGRRSNEYLNRFSNEGPSRRSSERFDRPSFRSSDVLSSGSPNILSSGPPSILSSGPPSILSSGPPSILSNMQPSILSNTSSTQHSVTNLHKDPFKQSNQQYTPKINQTVTSCLVTQGACGHGFHDHCIQKWLKTINNCPICRTPWNIQVEDMDNDIDWKKSYKSNKQV